MTETTKILDKLETELAFASRNPGSRDGTVAEYAAMLLEYIQEQRGPTMNSVKNKFAFYGFTRCPLTNSQLAFLLDRGFSWDSIYSIGCDVWAGHSMQTAVEMAKRGQQ